MRLGDVRFLRFVSVSVRSVTFEAGAQVENTIFVRRSRFKVLKISGNSVNSADERSPNKE